MSRPQGQADGERKLKAGFVGVVETPAGCFTPQHHSTLNKKTKPIRPIPLIQPTPDDLEGNVDKDDFPSDLEHDEKWASETNKRLIYLRDLLHKAGYKQVARLEPNEFGYVLFTHNSDRTDLITKLMRKIHTSNQFWLTDSDSGPAAAHEAQMAEKFFTVSKWYGLTSSCQVIQGGGSELEQFNFWGNLVSTSHSSSNYPLVQPPKLSQEDKSHINQFIESTKVEKLLKGSRDSGRSIPEASESVNTLKTLRYIFLKDTERAEKEIAQLSNTDEGDPFQYTAELSAAGKLLSLNFQRGYDALVKDTAEDCANANDVALQDAEYSNWTNLRDDANFMLEMGRAAKSLQQRDEHQDPFE